MTRVAGQPSNQPQGEHLILYDGVCGLCNRLNNFVLTRDTRAIFDFASLQSALGRSILQRFGQDPEDLNTFYVLTDYGSTTPTLLSRAGAALFVWNTLGWPWRAAGLFRVFPLSWLNPAYDLVARYRYRIFGRYDSCLVPSAEHRQRFLDV